MKTNPKREKTNQNKLSNYPKNWSQNVYILGIELDDLVSVKGWICWVHSKEAGALYVDLGGSLGLDFVNEVVTSIPKSTSTSFPLQSRMVLSQFLLKTP